MLAARAVRFRHPGAPAPLFDGLDLSVGAGECLCLIGPNGSGKTSLLKLLCGSLRPERGEVLLLERPVGSVRPKERARILAFVPQESRPMFNFTLLEVALMGRGPHLPRLALERPGDFAAARRALSRMDLERLEDRHLGELSSGERQRALIARALAQEPRVVLLDEPTAFLDLKHRLQIYEILAQLNRESGLTVVTVSHDLNLAARYAGRLVVLQGGRVVADGPPSVVLTPALLRSVYETDAGVERDPATGVPYVIPRAPLPGSGGAGGRPPGSRGGPQNSSR